MTADLLVVFGNVLNFLSAFCGTDCVQEKAKSSQSSSWVTFSLCGVVSCSYSHCTGSSSFCVSCVLRVVITVILSEFHFVLFVC